jgi:hypothetical protein
VSAGPTPDDGPTPDAGPTPSPAAATFRCSDAARDRDDDLHATAPPAARQLLVEMSGPWGRTALTESRLEHYVAGRLAEAADHAGVRVILVRRPGRPERPEHPADGEPATRAWALVDTRPGHRGVRWGSWSDPHALMDIDLRGPVPPSGPQRVALVCAHARHDICCAVRGRPVAAALAAETDWDVWESSHLGGDRFAANVLLLPSGELYGRLDPAAAVAAVRRFDAGRHTLPNWRGTCGRPPVEQAALHQAAVALGDDRRDAVRVLAVTERPGDRWSVQLSHVDATATERRFELHLRAVLAPPQLLTCAAVRPSRMRVFDLDGPLESEAVAR